MAGKRFDQQERLLEQLIVSQQRLSAQLTQLEQRLTRQDHGLQAIQAELKFLPVLWSLAALVFTVAGAAVLLLRNFWLL
ncbi:hypothetical protein CCP1ISM_2800002 [Azospirillaceae bacterium]